MTAALRGSLAHHPRAGSADAFSLFVSRSSAMGWLSSHGPGGCWGMNDAGSDSTGAWFQVSLTGESVPVQAFLACAADVVARLGEFRLESVELTVPVPPGTGSMMSLLQDAGWFADRDPRLITRARVAVDPFVPAALGWMRQFRQDVAAFSSLDDVELAEFSPAALGWLAAFLAEASARHGVTTPLTITASRA
ncbi:hypothetical protein ACWEIJ_38010 [Lentzea sp. NPDC004789]